MSNLRRSRTTPSRKKEHVDIILSRDMGFRMKTTGLEEWEFVNNALPELNLSSIDPSATFLNRSLALPLMISSMTGGYAEALRINRSLAEVCEENRIAMGVGSQRQALENAEYHRTFSVVREVAPTIPIIGNIGAAEVATMSTSTAAKRLVELIEADGLAVHLNPLQEFLQPEGNTNFAGVLKGIALLVRELPVPVIVKEIGAGISDDVARRLLEVGVEYIDVAGAGGTSWAGVEIMRRKNKVPTQQFWDWGIPTATSLRDVASLRTAGNRLKVIASGGITSGIHVAKCLALGADLVASARPILKTLHAGGKKELNALIKEWAFELRGVMFLTGSADIKSLRTATLVRSRHE